MSGFGGFLGGLGGATIGASVVSLILDTKRFDAGLVSAKARVTQSNVDMEASTSRFAGIAKAGFLAAGVAAIAFAQKAISAASDEEEALNKVNVVFARSAETVKAFAETSAESFGIARAQALGAAAGFGQMLLTAGLAEDAAARMSVDLVKLAADLASFNNIDPTEALEKLRSGLAGEAEPLRQLGILLSETRVKQEAYASGIAKTGAELTEAQKVQARYNLILQDSGKAQGDFERTSDSLANQQRILGARMADLAATLGRVLLPVVNTLIGALNALFAPVEALIELFTGSESIEEFSSRLKELGYATDEVDAKVKALEQTARNAQGGPRFLGRAMNDLEESFAASAAEAQRWAGAGQAAQAALDATRIKARQTGRGIEVFAERSGEAMKDFRSAVRGSNNFVRASWEELIGKSRVTATQIIRSFERALRQQNEFRENTAVFADKVQEAFGGRVPQAAREMIADLAQRGSEGAAVMAGLADANQNQIRRIVRQWKAGNEGPDAYLKTLKNVGDEIDSLTRSVHTIRIRLDVSSNASGADSQAVADALANELVRGQRD